MSGVDTSRRGPSRNVLIVGVVLTASLAFAAYEVRERTLYLLTTLDDEAFARFAKPAPCGSAFMTSTSMSLRTNVVTSSPRSWTTTSA